MAFTRKIRNRHPKCGIYQCENRARKWCGVCKNKLCEDCVRGHVAAHASRHMDGLRSQEREAVNAV